jgi:hypothetical protein
MTKYFVAIGVGTLGAYFLMEPVANFLGEDRPGYIVTKTIGDKAALALATGGVGAAVACLVVK